MAKIRNKKGKIIDVKGDLFSGVCDRHSHEIYENDEVKIYYKGKLVICKVYFKDGLFGLQWPDGYLNKWPITSDCEVINK